MLNPIDKRLYVAASRAKHSLYIFISMNGKDLSDVIDLRFKGAKEYTDKVKMLAIAMHGTGKIM